MWSMDKDDLHAGLKTAMRDVSYVLDHLSSDPTERNNELLTARNRLVLTLEAVNEAEVTGYNARWGTREYHVEAGLHANVFTVARTAANEPTEAVYVPPEMADYVNRLLAAGKRLRFEITVVE